MEDERKELKDILQSLQNDYGDLGVGIELLEEEIWNNKDYEEIEISPKKIIKLVKDIELWADSITDLVGDFDEAIEIYKKKQILNGLEDDENER